MLNASLMRGAVFAVSCVVGGSVISAPSYSVSFSSGEGAKQQIEGLKQVQVVGNEVSNVANDSKIVTVIGKGIGVDKENALKDAYRDAIERAVGMYVDAEQMVKNGKLVQDQILTHSNAYIERFDVKEEKKEPNGLIKVCILAQVKKSDLAKKMTKVLPPQVFKVGRELQDVHARLTTQVKRNLDGVALLKNGLSGLNPRDLINVSLVATTPFIRTDEKKPDKVYLYYLLKFEMNMDKYKEFASVLDGVLRQISLDGTKVVRGVVERKEDNVLKEVLNLDRFKSFEQYHWTYSETYFSRGYEGGCNPVFQISDNLIVKMCDTKVSSESMGAGSKFKYVLLMDDMPKYTLCKMKGYSVNTAMASVLHNWACDFKPQEGSRPFYYSMIFTGANGEELCLSQFSVSARYLINLSSNQNTMTFNIFPLIGGEAMAYYKWVRCEIPASALSEIKSLTIERTN